MYLINIINKQTMLLFFFVSLCKVCLRDYIYIYICGHYNIFVFFLNFKIKNTILKRILVLFFFFCILDFYHKKTQTFFVNSLSRRGPFRFIISP